MKTRHVEATVTIDGVVSYEGDLAETTSGDGVVQFFTARRADFGPIGAIGFVTLTDGSAWRVFVGGPGTLSRYAEEP